MSKETSSNQEKEKKTLKDRAHYPVDGAVGLVVDWSDVDGLVVTLQNQKKELEEDRKQYVFGHTMRMFINGKIREIDEVLGLLGVED